MSIIQMYDEKASRKNIIYRGNKHIVWVGFIGYQNISFDYNILAFRCLQLRVEGCEIRRGCMEEIGLNLMRIQIWWGISVEGKTFTPYCAGTNLLSKLWWMERSCGTNLLASFSPWRSEWSKIIYSFVQQFSKHCILIKCFLI